MVMSECEKIDTQRRQFLGQTTAALSGLGLVGLAFPFLSSWLPSSRTLSQGGSVEVDLSHLPEGGLMTVSWRGQPIWIMRRNAQDLQDLSLLNDLLRDPQSQSNQQPNFAKNIHRSIKPEVLVLVAVCTHLGCVPSFKPERGSLTPDWLGGFYCPCHGSKYDLAGRVYKGVPAPSNLQVPPYSFLSDTVLVIGEEA